MFWQKRLHFVQQHIAGQQIEKVVAVALCTESFDALLLMACRTGGSIHGDWLLVVGGWFGDLKPTIEPVSFL